MAVVGAGFTPEMKRFNENLSTRLIFPSSLSVKHKVCVSIRKEIRKVRCSLSSSSFVSPLQSENDAETGSVESFEEEQSGHVMRFKMSDFKLLDRVSAGLGGRGDEIVYEAIVNCTKSPLYNTKVVLRQFESPQAQRRGKRAIEVLKKLAHRRLLYHSYSMQVHGYVSSSTANRRGLFTLVHRYHGSFSLRHWLQQSDWLPTLEATLALDEESVRRVGDDTVGGPAVSRQLRIIRLLMRDLLIGVNYLHSHGLAHTELRLENVHISPVDRHIKVGILGNAADFYEDGPNSTMPDNPIDRREMMIAFDMKCVGYMMAKMVLQELMDPLIFTKFKSFLKKGNDPSCLREFLLQILDRNSPSSSAGLQILDRNSGAGWNLLSLLLANKPSKRIRSLDALRHPFLCGPRWRVTPSMDIIRWGLGSAIVRISEEYIYSRTQRDRIAYLIELMEMLNHNSRPKNWLELLPGKWRLLYSTGKHIGLTVRQPSARVLIGNVNLIISRPSKQHRNVSFKSDIGFTVMIGNNWPHEKTGIFGKLEVNSEFLLSLGRRLYIKEEKTNRRFSFGQSNNFNSLAKQISGKKWRKVVPFKEFPSSLPVAKLASNEIEMTMSFDDSISEGVSVRDIVQEVRTQIPPEMFDLSKIVCGTYIDSRLLVVRGVNGSALLFTRSCDDL